MSVHRFRAAMLTLLALMLVGSVAATTASAEAGPFWYHKGVGEKSEGVKLPEGVAESFEGSGGEQRLEGTVGGLRIRIKSPAVQVKGSIMNLPHQGQIKVAIFYQPLTVEGEGIRSPCEGKVGQQQQFSNIVVVKGHLAWKWNGTLTQLRELPQANQAWDIQFTNIEPQEQLTAREAEEKALDWRRNVGTFAEINLVGSGCGVAAGRQVVGGTEVGVPSKPSGINEFSRTLTLRTIPSGSNLEAFGRRVEGEGFLQHIWVGNFYQGYIDGLTFAGNPANLVGQYETTAAQQEIAVKEK